MLSWPTSLFKPETRMSFLTLLLLLPTLNLWQLFWILSSKHHTGSLSVCPPTALLSIDGGWFLQSEFSRLQWKLPSSRTLSMGSTVGWQWKRPTSLLPRVAASPAMAASSAWLQFLLTWSTLVSAPTEDTIWDPSPSSPPAWRWKWLLLMLLVHQLLFSFSLVPLEGWPIFCIKLNTLKTNPWFCPYWAAFFLYLRQVWICLWVASAVCSTFSFPHFKILWILLF